MVEIKYRIYDRVISIKYLNSCGRYNKPVLEKIHKTRRRSLMLIVGNGRNDHNVDASVHCLRMVQLQWMVTP